MNALQLISNDLKTTMQFSGLLKKYAPMFKSKPEVLVYAINTFAKRVDGTILLAILSDVNKIVPKNSEENKMKELIIKTLLKNVLK